MNVHEKLQEARCLLQSKEIKKSGKNSFAKYTYYELADFLPIINTIAKELKLCNVISFDREQATLTVVDTEKPEDRIVFTSPMAEAELKGCHPVQNLGAAETYQRRYLYTTAYEIVEADALDNLHNPNEETKKKEEYYCEECGQQIQRLQLQDGTFMPAKAVAGTMQEKYGKKLCVDCGKTHKEALEHTKNG